jgi:MerR family transcriptional regulator, light-induced transcriptional regulator
MAAGDDHALRIGELGRRVGVSSELLRAWERRYGLLRPVRTEGGFRLYSAEDERRVRLMQSHLARGVAAAEAAQLALAEPAPVGGSGWEREARALTQALESFEEQAAQVAFDRLLAALTVETVLSAVVLPYLHELGRRWEAGEASVAQEHFASNLLRGRLHGLARGWDRGGGPRALLACAPGELHDLPLLVFGIALHGRGWRITFLGPDTPIATVTETAAGISPDLVVVSAVDPQRFEDAADALRRLAADHTLVLAGGGASDALGDRIGCAVRRDDPVAAAEELAAGARPR